jgi:hypothetical protein
MVEFRKTMAQSSYGSERWSSEKIYLFFYSTLIIFKVFSISLAPNDSSLSAPFHPGGPGPAAGKPALLGE